MPVSAQKWGLTKSEASISRNLARKCVGSSTHLRARFREVGASLLVSPHYWVLTGMSTMPPSGRSKKLVPEFLEEIIHDQNVRQQPLSSPRLRMGNFAATVKSEVFSNIGFFALSDIDAPLIFGKSASPFSCVLNVV